MCYAQVFSGFQLIERIGGGGFSTWASCNRVIIWTRPLRRRLIISVYKAVNFDEHRVAACKVIALTDETTEKERKTLDKEIRVHAAMKHTNVLEFLNAAIVENEPNARYVPAIYMLLELASGGDLFDKIGTYDTIVKTFTSEAQTWFLLIMQHRRLVWKRK